MDLKLLQILSKIPRYYLFRRLGRPRKLPLNLTLSVSFKCNSRCKTCNIYKKKANELSLGEWQKVFQYLGKTLFWTTISGGEPFLRNDLRELVCSLYDICRPEIISIPTNGLLPDRISKTVMQIVDHCKEAQIVINVSIDDINERNDVIRGVQGSYKKATETFSALKAMDRSNLSVGIHTVISRFNADRIPDIYKQLMVLDPDSYITEIAEEREELDTIGKDISPDYQDYADAVDFLIKNLKDGHFNRVGKITRAFRIEYYRMVKKILAERRQIIPCYSGYASAQIAPDGDVWFCCIKAESIGNLREFDYNFQRIWFSHKAEILRKSIKKGECFCPLANTGYTNMLHHGKTLSRIGWNLFSME